MEKNVLFWAIGIIVVAAFLFNVGEFTGSVAKAKIDPVVTITNSPVMQGFSVLVSVRDGETTSQEFKIYESSGKYTGKRFFARASKCSSRKAAGTYDCDLEYKIPAAMNAGSYYVQAKNRRGEMVGNKALFTVA